MEQNNMDAKTIAQITKNERTPLYVFDLDALRTRVRMVLCQEKVQIKCNQFSLF